MSNQYDLPGNPFALHSIPPQMEYVDAIMALAFEQRTANLIKLFELHFGSTIYREMLSREIYKRLGEK